MKSLLYGCAFITPEWQDRFVPMVNTMIKSARIQGYTGDIVILSDRKIPIEGAELIITPPVPIRLTYPYDILLMRTRLWRYVNLAKYDYVLYLDADILINKPIDPLLEELNRYKVLTAQGEGKCLKHAPTHQTDLSAHERVMYQWEQTFCTGVVGFPTDARGMQFLKDWEIACDHCNSNDQTAFNAMVFRKYRNQVIPTPWTGYHCGDNPSENVICHFFRQKCKKAYYGFYEKYILPKATEKHN